MDKVLLRLLEPDSGRLVGCPVSRVGSDGIWSFPLAYQTYSEDRAGRVQILHIADGVAGDTLGVNPPEFQLELTFGAKPKTIRGVTYEPRELLDDLHAFIVWYFQDRREALRVRRPQIEMAFDDFVNDRHWIVLPAGAPQIRRSSREPTRPTFSLRLSALRPVSSIPAPTTGRLPEELAPGSRSQVATVAAARFGA